MKNAVAAILMALGAIAAVLWAAQWGFKNPVFDTNQSAGSGQSVDPGSETAADQSAVNQPVQSPDNQQVAVLETGLQNLAAINFSSLQRTTAQRAQTQSASGTGSADDATDPATVQRRRAPVRASW